MRDWGQRLTGGLTSERLQTVGFGLGVVVITMLSALILSFDEVFPASVGLGTLQVGSVTSSDIRAPFGITYTSDVLTEARRRAAVDQVSAIYQPPDPSVARQQVALLGQIIDFVEDVRSDPYGTTAQKASDIEKITALALDPSMSTVVVGMDGDTWNAVRAEMALVLERIMRESIRESDLPQVIDQLPMQVSVRFDPVAAGVVAAFVRDLLRPNRFVNAAATTTAQSAAADAVIPESRSFERGQIIVRAGELIDDADYEALQQFNLLDTPDQRFESFLRALMACGVVFVSFGLYVNRSNRQLASQRGLILLLGAMFVITLLGARAFSGDAGVITLYPAAGLTLLVVAISGVDVALLVSMALAFLIGWLGEASLEVAALVGVGAVMGTLSLRRSERLNSFFFAGLVVALANIIVIGMFHLGTPNAEGVNTALLFLYALFNGVLSGMVALAGLYLITLLFNLPTGLKLVELSQPSQPLLQRLLREAPGTYQHSLQVANLGEQAADAVGANAALVRVAALYHDIGKILNPAFFVENQADNVNPHDMLNDPYRSADLIISHVVDGDKMARSYRLPQRIRDFILEHHGTTLVSYFYNQALSQAGSDETVDADQFTYPGPKPRSRETAILMLADNCESTVRAIKPSNKAQIEEIIDRIFDTRVREGQLSASGLTLNDLPTVRDIFVDMLQAVFHPRIQYPNAPSPELGKRHPDDRLPESTIAGLSEVGTSKLVAPRIEPPKEAEIKREPAPPTPPPIPRYSQTQDISPAILDDDDSPMPDVPPLPRRTDENGEVKPPKDNHV